MSTRGNVPVNDLTAANGSAILHFWVVDSTSLGGNLLYFYNGVNENGGNLVWQSQEYQKFPIDATGFDYKADGPQGRPRVSLGDDQGMISALVRLLGGIEGAKVIRKRTLAKYIDAVNFKPIQAVAWQFATGEGSRFVWTLSVPNGGAPANPTVTAVSRVDWYGSRTLSPLPRTNLIKSSIYFNLYWNWAFSGTGIAPVVTANCAIAPDGTYTASRVYTNQGAGRTSADYSMLTQATGINTNPGSRYTLSLWLKSNNGSNQTIYISVSGTWGTGVTIDNTWKRYTLKFSASSAAQQIVPYVGNRMVYVNAGNIGDFLIWNVQVEENSNETPDIICPSNSIRTVTDYLVAGTSVTFDTSYNPIPSGSLGLSDGSQSVWGVTVPGAITPTIVRALRTDFHGGIRKNHLPYSKSLSGSGWSSAALTTNVNAAIAPDGTMTAMQLVEDSTNTTHYRGCYPRISVEDNDIVVFSIYAKAGSDKYITLQINTKNPVYPKAEFDLTSGTLSYSSGSPTYGISDAGNGWWRVWMSINIGSGPAMPAVNVFLTHTSGVTSYLGNGSSNAYIWGAQFEKGITPTTLIFTNGTPVYVFDGPATLCYPVARQNMCGYSQDFDNAAWVKSQSGTGVLPIVTPNQFIAPDGTQTADGIIMDKGAGTAQTDFSFLQGAALATSINVGYIASLWMRTTDGTTKLIYMGTAQTGGQAFSVDGTWKRFTFYGVLGVSGSNYPRICLRGGNGTSDTANFAAWGFQYEIGDVATPYIPTMSAPVTVTDYSVAGSNITFNPCSVSMANVYIGTGNGVATTATLTTPNGATPTVHNIWRHDWQGRQKLYSKSRSNLISRSEELDQWALTGATVTVNNWTAPDGSLTGDSIVESTANSGHQATKNFASTAGSYYTASVFAKAGTRRYLRFAINDGASFALAVFDLQNGTVFSTTSGSAYMINYGGGIWRCVVSGLCVTSNASATIYAQMCIDGVNAVYTGDGSSYLQLWGMSVEPFGYLTSYIKTTTTTVTVTDYTVSIFTVTFATAPLNAAALEADISYLGPAPIGSTLTWSGYYMGGPDVGAQLNWTGFCYSNPTANPSIQFADQVYRIEQKEVEIPKQFITFMLASPLDRQGLKLPRRQFRQNLCYWTFMSADCGYFGLMPTCDKGLYTSNGCVAHFGNDAVIPAGLFPAVGLVTV